MLFGITFLVFLQFWRSQLVFYTVILGKSWLNLYRTLFVNKQKCSHGRQDLFFWRKTSLELWDFA